METGIHYFPALHEQPALAGLHLSPTGLTRAEDWAAEELSLPIFPAIDQAQIEHVGIGDRRPLAMRSRLAFGHGAVVG